MYLLEQIKNNLNSKQKESTYLSSFFFLVFLDQIIKRNIIFKINIFKNYYFAFSLPLPQYLIYSIYFFVTFGIFYYIYSNYKNFIPLHKFAWTLILAGGLSNIVERTIFGYVVDWIYILNGVLNLADFYIILGVLFLFFVNIKAEKVN